ncbi:MAG: phosphoribosylglycinamide formyltransferase [Chitinivibrionales bacterium]|nr:phosphoribosylglycinamide formyltransferase [Chitinivibrionales bacterium]
MRCVVFASGGGSNFGALLDRREAGDLPCDFALLIGNNSGAGAFERARRHGVPTLHLAPSQFTGENLYAARLADALEKSGAELLVLAGYMKKLPPAIVAAYRDRIVNVHPALLPAFGGKGLYGRNVHQAVLDYGAKISGVTVHFVTEEYDQGPIIMQQAVPVLEGDTAETLAARVLAAEHDTYWRAINAIALGKVTVTGRKVCVSE